MPVLLKIKMKVLPVTELSLSEEIKLFKLCRKFFSSGILSFLIALITVLFGIQYSREKQDSIAKNLIYTVEKGIY